MSDSAPTSSETPPTAKRRLSPSRRLKVLLTLAIVAVMALWAYRKVTRYGPLGAEVTAGAP